MQPYFFPYPGYFELIANADLFVILNDVQYTRGWINRNRIKSNIDWMYITVPVCKHFQTDKITDIKICNSWKYLIQKQIKSFKHSYGTKLDLEFLDFYLSLSSYSFLYSLLKETIFWMCSKLGIKTNIIESSYYPSLFSGEERIINLCLQLGATDYLNLPGGRSLYDIKNFSKYNINLEFLPLTNKGNLSILDFYFNEKDNLLFHKWA